MIHPCQYVLTAPRWTEVYAAFFAAGTTALADYLASLYTQAWATITVVTRVPRSRSEKTSSLTAHIAGDI